MTSNHFSTVKNNQRSALLIIDVQYDFLPGGSLAVPEGDQIIPLINQLPPYFDVTIATQDWHPVGHSSFASQYPQHQPFEVVEFNGSSQTLWPDHCLQASRGAQLAQQLNQAPIEAIFRKGMDPAIDSYSGFYDNNHQRSTGLASYLQEKQVGTVYCTGLAGDVCVYYTAKDAAQLGFSTYIIDDAIRCIDNEHYQSLKQHLQSIGVQWTMHHRIAT